MINMARFLQSLDADASPRQGIDINEDVLACLSNTYYHLGLTDVDFANTDQVGNLIQKTADTCEDVPLVVVSKADAKANLEDALSSNMFRKNVSKSPELTSSKSKLDIMGVWFPAKKANGEAVEVEYHDANGNLIRTAEEAKPVVVVYTDGVEGYDAEDIFAGISRDDGNTFKRMNLSRAADRRR